MILNLIKRETDLREKILRVVRDRNPETVKQLVKTVLEGEESISEAQVMEQLLELQSEGLIKLKEPQFLPALNLSTYLSSSKAYWYWGTIAFAFFTAALVFAVPQGANPAAYLRNVSGSIFVLLLPGYSLIRALFPSEALVKSAPKTLDNLFRIVLSIGVSLALVPITDLVLNYGGGSLDETSITLSLLALVVTASTVGILREYQSQAKART